MRGVEDTSALLSRHSYHARSARKAPRMTCIVTATLVKAIPSRSPKLSRRRRLGGGGGGGGRCLRCRWRCRCAGGGGGDDASKADAACRCVAGTVGGDAVGGGEERDGEATDTRGTVGHLLRWIGRQPAEEARATAGLAGGGGERERQRA